MALPPIPKPEGQERQARAEVQSRQPRGRTVLSKSKTPEPLYRRIIPEEDRGKTVVSKYYRVNRNMDGLGTGLHPYNIECNLRIDFDLDGGIYKVEWSNKVLGERK